MRGARYIDNRGERDHVISGVARLRVDRPPRAATITSTGATPTSRSSTRSSSRPSNGTLTIKVEDNTEDGARASTPSPSRIRTSPSRTPRSFHAKVGVSDPALEDSPLPRGSLALPLVFNTAGPEPWCASTRSVHACVSSCPRTTASSSRAATTCRPARRKQLRWRRRRHGVLAPYPVAQRRGRPLRLLRAQGEGRRILLPYNTIRKEVQNPIHCHGYSLYDDGRMVVFRDQDVRGPYSGPHHADLADALHQRRGGSAAAPSTGSVPRDDRQSRTWSARISDSFSLRRAIERPGRRAGPSTKIGDRRP